MKTEKETDKRALTISRHYSQRVFHNSCFVPKIRLCGKWLENAGFEIGDQITVHVSKKCLIIFPERFEDHL